MSKPRTFLAFIAALLCGSSLGAQQDTLPSKGRSYVSFEPVNTVTVKTGHPSPVEFTFHIQSGFHINSSQPTTPELIPTQLRFSLPGDLVIGRMQYPAGKLTSFPFDPSQKLSVYSNDLIIKALVSTPSNASAGMHTVHGELRYQACDDNACYPPKKLPIEFNVNITKAGSSRHGTRAHGNKQSPHIH